MNDPAERLSAALSDNYRIDREIGKGGMATVYLAEDVRHGRKVAIKVLLPELAAVLGAERFLSEIHVTAALQHPNILPLFDSGNVDGQLYYVMPYIEGESLRARLDRERQLPIDDALRIAREVGSALSYAHRHGVIHRDIKPENILLHDGHALVADFGIALAVTSAGGGRLTQTGLSLGTPQYMSPEQATGEREIDARSDLYSLAAVIYEMLGGEPPHTGSTMQAVIARMLTERPRNLRTTRPSVPEYVATALEVALERIPADRWHSVEEFQQALDGKVDVTHRGDSASVPSKPRKPVAMGLHERVRDPVTIGLIVLALALSAVAARGYFIKRDAAGLPTARFLITLPPATRIETTEQNGFAISPNGRTIVFAGRDAARTRRIFVRLLDDAHARALPGSEGGFSAFFSPDGRWIGFVGSGGVKKISLQTGDVLPVAAIKGLYGGASWSSRREIVVTMNNSRLFAIPENGGPERKVCGKSGDGIITQAEPQVLADGETVLFAGATSGSLTSSRLAVASLRTGECTLLDMPAIQPLGVVDEFVMFATLSGVVMAAPFDEGKKRITGAAVPVISDVDVNQTSGAAQAALSANGSLVYLDASALTQIVSVDSHGTAQPILQEARTYAFPRYSPDGRKIAVAVASTAQRDIWVIDVAAGTTSRLTSGGFINDRPEWTPDGKRILYRASRSKRSSLWWRAADLSDNESPLLTNDAEDYYEGVLSPDGKSLVYQVDTSGADIYSQSMSSDHAKKPLAVSEFVEVMPRVSPDGHWLAYVSDASGAEEVVVQPFPGPGALVQVSTRGGAEPVWARDGSKLYYRDEQNLVAARFQTVPNFAVTSREVVFPDAFVKRSLPHANYDVSPDGSHFLFLKPTSEAEAVVVYNWIAEVRARLKASVGN